MARITDVSLLELLSKVTPGNWGVGSSEEYEFYIYSKDSDPIKYILRDIAETTSNYDLRLLALAKELAEECVEHRRKQRKLA